jgi:hypothetical protein
MQEILRMNLAALAGWLTPAATTPRRSGPVISPAPDRIHAFTIGADSALYHKLYHQAWDAHP